MRKQRKNGKVITVQPDHYWRQVGMPESFYGRRRKIKQSKQQWKLVLTGSGYRQIKQ